MNEIPLTLEHRKLLFAPLRELGLEVSEYCFANLYLFRREHSYRISEEGELFVFGVTRDGRSYAMPTRDVRAIPVNIVHKAIHAHGMMFPIPEAWLAAFDPDIYFIESLDADSDYIHDIAKLTAYSGNRLHGKKNLMNQFIRRYTPEAKPLTSHLLSKAREVLDAWQMETAASHVGTDYDACNKALELYDVLGLCGGIYFADSKPAGFVIGEELTMTTFALHFAKGSRAFLGVNQYMFSQFASIMPATYKDFNFEQDLGIESLRRSKSSYHPERMVRKYRISLKQRQAVV
jgi:hypothetical protein